MEKFYKKNILLILLGLSFTPLLGQELKGKIVDASGLNMPGVSILIQGTTNGTSSDSNGAYLLKFSSPGKYKLKISFLGYENLIADVQIDNATKTQNFTMVASGTALNEIVVVGSRSTVPRTNIESPVPVDVITSKDVKSFAQVDIGQVLNYNAPSFSSNRQTVADGTDHLDPASLRGLGPDQVLVLVNGKRRHTSALVNINGTFGRGSVGTDLNAIPLAAVEKIEVLRDGAAAQYGSDAMAGVINIVLKKDTPFAFSMMQGQCYTSALGRNMYDGQTFNADLSNGFDLGGKGFVNFAAQYEDRGATNRGGLDTRPLLYSPVPSSGMITQAQVDADNAKAAAGFFDRNDMRVGNSDSKRASFFVNGQYQLGNDLNFYLATGYTNNIGQSAGFNRLPSQTSQIDLSIYPNGFLPLEDIHVNDYSILGGVKGKSGAWDYDLGHAYGMNTIDFNVSNSLNASYPPGTSPTSFYCGTVSFIQNTTTFDINRKFDFKGPLTSLNTAFGVEYRAEDFQIIAGDPSSYLSEGVSSKVPGAQVFPGFQPAPINALDKSRNNKGIYVDLEGDFGPRLLLEAAGRLENYSDFGSNFSYKFTSRYKFYQDFAVRGSIATGFRAPSLQQRYFSNVSTQFINGTANQVLTVNNDNPIVRAFGIGSLKAETSNSYSLGLTGKISQVLSFTVDAYQIDVKNRIVLSSAYTRQLNPDGTQVATDPVNQILNNANVSANINSVQFFSNAVSTKTQGLDAVLTSRMNLGFKGDKLVLSAALNLNKTNVGGINTSNLIANNPILTNNLFNRYTRCLLESAVPKSKIDLSANYINKRWGILLRAVRFGEVTYLNQVDPTIPSNNLPLAIDQTFAAKWVTDLTVNYTFTKQFNFAIGINNLFDVYPDQAYIDPRNNVNNLTNYTGGRDNTYNGRFLYSRNVQQFGFNGRFIFGKVSYAF